MCHQDLETGVDVNCLSKAGCFLTCTDATVRTQLFEHNILCRIYEDVNDEQGKRRLLRLLYACEAGSVTSTLDVIPRTGHYPYQGLHLCWQYTVLLGGGVLMLS